MKGCLARMSRSWQDNCVIMHGKYSAMNKDFLDEDDYVLYHHLFLACVMEHGWKPTILDFLIVVTSILSFFSFFF